MADKCIEKDFTKAEDIKVYFSEINFKEGTWLISIFETNNPSNHICLHYNKTKRPKTYFGNSDDSSKHYINSKAAARWKVIQYEMDKNNIKNVTIKLCPKLMIK